MSLTFQGEASLVKSQEPFQTDCTAGAAGKTEGSREGP